MRKIIVKKYNLTAIVVFITLVEGLAIYINMIAHPELQPNLSALITILAAIGSGFAIWYVNGDRGMKLA